MNSKIRTSAARNTRARIATSAATAVAIIMTATPGAAPALAARSGSGFTVDVTGTCSTDAPGLLVDFHITNERQHDVAFTITVYRNFRETFVDDEIAPPGESKLRYGPSPDARWRFVVTTGRRVKADQEFNVSCEG